MRVHKMMSKGHNCIGIAKYSRYKPRDRTVFSFLFFFDEVVNEQH